MKRNKPLRYLVMKNPDMAFYITLFGYLASGIWMVAWQLWLSPHQHLDATTMALFWLVPWMLPIVGILKRNSYTNAWSCFIALLYLTHALVIIVVAPQERWLAVIELLTVSLWLGGAVTFIRSDSEAKRLRDSASA